MSARRTAWSTGSMQAHIIRVHSLSDSQSTFSLAVLADSTQEAMVAVVRQLALCDVAEVTNEVLDPLLAERIGLLPGCPHRLPRSRTTNGDWHAEGVAGIGAMLISYAPSGDQPGRAG